MKKHTVKPPIDDLFARKLSNMSISPSSDGFKRLQTRMGKNTKQTRVVFWQSPAFRQSMAAAACLVLVSVLGRVYWQSDNEKETGRLAHNKLKKVASDQLAGESSQRTTAEDVAPSGVSTANSKVSDEIDLRVKKNRLAQVNKPVKNDRKSTRSSAIAVPSSPTPAANKESVVAQTRPSIVNKTLEPDPATATLAPAPSELAQNTAKVAKPVERVLEVTIAEPDALVAARQAAQEADDKIVVINAKETKKTGLGKVLSQLRQARGNDTVVAARGDDGERGLLGRAYNGIKRSLEKEKSHKQ